MPDSRSHERADTLPETGYPRVWSPVRAVYAVLTGSLLVLAFPLYGDRYHLDHLVWLVFVPLFLAAQGVGARRGFFLGWLAGMTLEAAGFLWILYAIRRFGGGGPLLSSLMFGGWVAYSSVPWALLGLALGRCRRPAQVLWVLPLWVGIEALFPRIWPWHVGGAIHARSWLLQCVDLLGASGMTALIFLVNVALYRLLLWRLQQRRDDVVFPRALVATAAGCVVVALVYGAVRKSQLEAFHDQQPEIRVGFVHGSLDPDRRRSEGQEYYLAATKKLVAEEPDVDVVLWPEGANRWAFDLTEGADPWFENRGPGAQQPRRSDPVPIRDEVDTAMVVGGVAIRRLGPTFAAGYENYNIAAYITSDNHVAAYRKNRPVPFGESVPFLDRLPAGARNFVHEVFPNVGNLDLGDDNPAMSLDGHTFRNLVCYEAVIPDYVRRASIGSDFLVNITEDYWYGLTAHIPQHLSVFLLRAVESRIPVARCANLGPSGVVDVVGRWQTGGEVGGEGRFVRTLRPGRGDSFYRVAGHWFPVLCLVLGGYLFVRLGADRAAAGGRRGEREG